MDNDKSLIKDYLYIDYEEEYNLKKNKKIYLSNLFDKLSKLNLNLQEFKNQNELIKNMLSSCQIDTNFNDTFNFVHNLINGVMSRNILFINKIMEFIIKIRELTDPCLTKFEDFFQEQKKFTSSLNELNNCQTNYFKSVANAESTTFKFLKKKLFNRKENPNEFDEKEQSKFKAKAELEKYKFNINENNKKLTLFYEKQKDICDFNKILEIKYNEIYSNILNEYDKYKKEINNLFLKEENEITNLTNNIKIENDKFDLNNKKQLEIKFMQYKSNIKFENCDDGKELSACLLTYNEVSEMIGNYKEFEFEKENEKLSYGEQISEIFNLDENIEEENENKLIEIINDDVGKQIFLNLLNKLRANGKYQKSEVFIKLIGKIFNMTLDLAEKTNDYDWARNCIILSETFYYLENDTKIYVFNSIKQNKWLKKINFWKGFIEFNLNGEIEKIKNHTKQNLKDILLNVLVPIINNMKCCDVDIRIIIKITDEFLDKYNYLDEEDVSTLFGILSIDMEEVDKYRKEYKENPDLEKLL